MKIKYLFLLSTICTLFITNTFAQKKKKDKPYNILWLSCEDIGPIIGAYGAKGVQTPNIDKLAKEGILYKHAYATVGVCAPSRSSIITGMYPVSIGSQHMRSGFHVNYREPDKETYKTYQQTTDRLGRNVPQYSTVPPSYVKCFPEYLRAEGYYCSNNAKCDYQFFCPMTAWDDSKYGATYRNRKKGQPFFSVINYNVSHESMLWKRAKEPFTVEQSEVRVPKYFPDIPVVRKDLARKYSNIEELDKQIGEAIAQLEKDGELDNTIIFFWSDHGGPMLRQKRAVGNTGLQVPLIVRFPDKRMAGTEVEEIVSLMDLGPTVLSLAGIEPPKYMQGKAFLGEYKAEKTHQYAFGSADRFDEHTDMSRSVIDGRYVYIRNFMPHLPLTYRLGYREQVEMTKEVIEMNRRNELEGDAKYIFMPSKPIEELYDLKNDPDEVHNLAEDPAHRAKLEELRAALSKWQLEIGDLGFVPEQDLINMMWPGLKQPSTQKVSFEVVKKSKREQKVALSCSTEGASIAYQKGDEIGSKHWNLYHTPIAVKKGEKIVSRAVRIGYKTSEKAYFDMAQ